MRRRYSNIQKKLAVERALKSRKRAKDVANELKISPSTLYRWLKEEDSSRSSKKIKYISRELEKRIRKVQDERKVLLRALQIMARELAD